jgi:dCMP deaminase
MKRKVGAVLVYKDRVIATGYNGTKPGTDNCCEDINGVTNPDVIHAEMNLFNFCTEEAIPTDGCDLYVTLMPCAECAIEIAQRGIKNVYYSCESGKGKAGRDILYGHNINCQAL